MSDYTLPLDELPDPLPIVPLSKPFDVTITPPGSKSITCRAYVLAALAEGESKIIRPLRAEDTNGLLDALCTLGAIARWDGEDVFIKGVAGRFPRGGEVNLGDGGTPTRFMIACACLAAEPVVVDGSARMRERPIAEGVDMLRQLGAKIEYIEEEGRLPVRVVPSDEFKGGELTIGKTASSQFISALVLIAPWLNEGIQLRFQGVPTSESYVVLSLKMVDDWGARCEAHISNDSGSLRVWTEHITSCLYTVEPDASALVYWLGASAIVPGAVVQNPLRNEYSVQPDAWFWSRLKKIGVHTLEFDAETDLYPGAIRGPELLQGCEITMQDMPDAAMMFATILAISNTTSMVSGLHTLRVKETDRIAALANELRKVGCEIETTDDSITITPMPRDDDGNFTNTNPVIIESYNDHRMAMAFAVLGLVRPGISIRNPRCVAKSYPGFWHDFAKLYQ